MSKIKIKNFGPIKEGCIENDGWIDVKKVTVFIGNQGSGKSTIAKAISTLSWVEKSINRGDTEKGISFAKFIEFFEYQQIRNYFSETTYIEYSGEKYYILYDRTNEYPIIKEVLIDKYKVPKIIYIPAERNFLNADFAFKIKGLPENIFGFAADYRDAQNELNGERINLPIGDYKYEFDKEMGQSYIIGSNYQLQLTEASSGIQSFVPLYVVSRYLSKYKSDENENSAKSLSVNLAMQMASEIMGIMDDASLSDSDKNQKVKSTKAKYFNKCLINIIEEPEQNLFPTSQWEMLKSLLEFNNMNEGNKLIMTTHSPYLINYLSIAIQAGYLKNKIKVDELKNKLNKIIPYNSTIQSMDIVIYQLDEKTGLITKLPDYEGIPSDKNYLNQSLRHGNEMFDSLLEIEQEL